MKLIWFSINGYKRFQRQSKMNLDGKLVAIIGPNEAGKTSFLKALHHMNDHVPFVKSGGSQELSRGASIPPDQRVIEAGFLLDEADHKAIAHIPGGDKVRWRITHQQVEGDRFLTNILPRPMRDLQPRRMVASRLKDTLRDPALQQLSNDSNNSFSLSAVEALISQLDVETDNLPNEVLTNITKVADEIKKVLPKHDAPYLHELSDRLAVLPDLEGVKDPYTAIREILWERRPQFLLFTEEARALKSEYALDNKDNKYPQSLQNLARLAGLNLGELDKAVSENDHGQIETIMEDANEKLKRVMEETWSQFGVTVRLRVDGAVLRILVGSSKTSFVSIAERSDGLRQFIALLAFTQQARTDRSIILLIDEAETHLHYDAQADLVQMFAKQEVVSKIIYTTHSIGCLPEDLGTGVRLVEFSDKDNSSVIRNWFWDSERPGFSPLLFGMGARTLAFVPLRFSLIAEGITEIILLPTLLREATARSYLGFQVVPGLSSASETEIASLEHEAPRTAYPVDADSGGAELRKKLLRAGIAEDRIFQLPGDEKRGMALEDYLEAEVYLAAVNEELRRSHGSSVAFPPELLPDAGRPSALKAWCVSKDLEVPSKRAIAYHALEAQSEMRLLPEKHKESFRQLFKRITDVLKKPD